LVFSFCSTRYLKLSRLATNFLSTKPLEEGGREAYRNALAGFGEF
jgi:hypothetical protein